MNLADAPLSAISTENARTNGNVMMELTSQRTGETYWFNPVRVADELEHPEKYPTSNNGLKFRHDLEESGLRITQVVPLELDQASSMPETLKRQMAIRTFARTRGYEFSGAYEGHYIQRKKPNQS